ncbi:MAG: carboxypeptidase-like regulatory domain-containing protein [Terriglobia bacterium]
MGRATDTSGASIPGALVKITDTARGTVRTVTTNMAEAYAMPDLTTSTYSMKVSAKGFRTIVRNGLILDMAQTLPINFRLERGESRKR